ncbi:MAG: Fic family protein [Microbacteriaceae bacterium]|nr:Fic family protein [Microbacteriaceae bacterium]
MQNWVGGTGWSPLRAEFVPPPEDLVPELVDHLAQFISATDGNPVVRAAIAHAQCETIHPFVDGNGRTGRALIHTVLARTGTIRNVLIPISAVFAGSTDACIRGLTAFRAEPADLDTWVMAFSAAASVAAAAATGSVEKVEALDERSRRQPIDFRRARGYSPAAPRRDAVILRVLENLSRHPVLTLEPIAAETGAARGAASRAVDELTRAGVLTRIGNHKGATVGWSADQYLALAGLTSRGDGRCPRAHPP